MDDQNEAVRSMTPDVTHPKGTGRLPSWYNIIDKYNYAESKQYNETR